MANAVNIQTILDGDRNVVVLATGILDTSDVALAILVDVSALVPAATGVAILEAKWSVSSQLALRLFWDQTADAQALIMTNSDHQKFRHFGGLVSPRGAGFTGDLLYSTSGWASGIQTYSLQLTMAKQFG